MIRYLMMSSFGSRGSSSGSNRGSLSRSGRLGSEGSSLGVSGTGDALAVLPLGDQEGETTSNDLNVT